jgi:hypothetical protein
MLIVGDIETLIINVNGYIVNNISIFCGVKYKTNTVIKEFNKIVKNSMNLFVVEG